MNKPKINWQDIIEAVAETGLCCGESFGFWPCDGDEDRADCRECWATILDQAHNSNEWEPEQSTKITGTNHEN